MHQTWTRKIGSPPKRTFNHVRFAHFLKGHPNETILVDHITNGFPLNIASNAQIENLSISRSTFWNNKREMLKIFDTFIDELEKGVLIPYTDDPDAIHYIINVFCTPKKGKDGKMSALRCVRHGSHKKKRQNFFK